MNHFQHKRKSIIDEENGDLHIPDNKNIVLTDDDDSMYSVTSEESETSQHDKEGLTTVFRLMLLLLLAVSVTVAIAVVFATTTTTMMTSPSFDVFDALRDSNVDLEPSRCRECVDLWGSLHESHVGVEACTIECEDKDKDETFCETLCNMKDSFVACQKVGICTLQDSRFNKLPAVMDKDSVSSTTYVGGVHKAIFPLLPEDFRPLEKSKAMILKQETKADSVVISGDLQLYGSDGEVDHWLSEDPITGATVNPVFPGMEGFWDELEQVVVAQISREEGQVAQEGWPETWMDRSMVNLSPWQSDQTYGNLTYADVAQAVNGEYPAYHQQIFLKLLFSQGVISTDLGQPFRSNVDFVGKVVRLGEINTWAFEVVAPVNFMLKWHFGMPRPEEMAYKISMGDYTEEDQVPSDLVHLIRSMNLQNAHDFTAYKNKGSPFHPSFPAMHSAGSTCSFWLAALCQLSGEQFLEALRVDYAVAMGRTVAGVHYVQDNLVGLNLGQRILREKLPGFLSEMYGYDPELVRERLNRLSFDWKDFDSARGTIAGVPVADFLNEAMS